MNIQLKVSSNSNASFHCHTFYIKEMVKSKYGIELDNDFITRNTMVSDNIAIMNCEYELSYTEERMMLARKAICDVIKAGDLVFFYEEFGTLLRLGEVINTDGNLFAIEPLQKKWCVAKPKVLRPQKIKHESERWSYETWNNLPYDISYYSKPKDGEMVGVYYYEIVPYGLVTNHQLSNLKTPIIIYDGDKFRLLVNPVGRHDDIISCFVECGEIVDGFNKNHRLYKEDPKKFEFEWFDDKDTAISRSVELKQNIVEANERG